MLDVRRLMLLCDLAELGTIGAVAERRGVTSSAVSQQFRVLEEEVDAVLLQREGRILRLTRSGQILVDHAQKVLQALDGASSAIAEAKSRRNEVVSIAGFPGSISTFIGPLVRSLQNEQTDLRLRVLQLDTADSLRSLSRGDIDLALTSQFSFDRPTAYAGLSSDPLISDPLVLLAPRKLHPRIERFGIAALASEPWISIGSGSRLYSALVGICGEAGFAPSISHHVVHAASMCELAAAGAGMAIVPLLTVPDDCRDLVVEPLSLGSRTVCVSQRLGTRTNPVLRSLVNELHHYADSIGFAVSTPRTA